MPEYKRFIAYFYEYIDGRKKKNAGFAKVELRNGMWRVLFRIRTDQMPEAPVQVFGFVRERGYLLGFLLGNMNGGYEISEEWAYGAEKEIGHGKYRFGNLSGIWIQSGDGRKFITVWDDDPIDVQKFVLKMPEGKTVENKRETEQTELTDAGEVMLEKAEAAKLSGIEIKTEAEVNIGEKAEIPEDRNGGKNAELLKSKISKNAEQELSEEWDKNIQQENYETKAERLIDKNTEKVLEQSIEEISRNGQEAEKDKIRDKKQDIEPWLAELFCRRKHVQPFMDGQITDCIQIMPCDLVKLQQNGWQVGRSSFLQHGFYQYHHLLLGKNADGDYVLGVPGQKNAQEQYMAQLFGYDKFLRARVYDCGRIFGYWCRNL